MKKITKRQQEKLDYAKWVASIAALSTNFARQKHPPQKSVLHYSLSPPAGRMSAEIPSLVTPGHSTPKRQDQRYTGTSMLGIGVLHKSNAVPVFAEADAKDLARMRR